jgi:hypothetical protein
MKLQHSVSFLATVVLLLPCALSGQTRFGIRAGMDLANRSQSESLPSGLSSSLRNGLIIGVTLQQGITQSISVSAEPTYIQKGQVITGSTNNLYQTLTAKAAYIEIPVSAKMRLSDGLVSPYLTAGPFFSVLLSAGGTTEFNGLQSDWGNQKNIYQSIELGIQGGIGAQYHFATDISFLAEVNYSHGLTPILKEPFNQSLRSYGFLFMLGAIYNL